MLSVPERRQRNIVEIGITPAVNEHLRPGEPEGQLEWRLLQTIVDDGFLPSLRATITVQQVADLLRAVRTHGLHHEHKSWWQPVGHAQAEHDVVDVREAQPGPSPDHFD